MEPAVIVLGIVIAIAVITAVVVATRAAVRRVASASAQAIEREFAGVDLVRTAPMANYFGLESKGGKQIRGNGALVLTADEVWFQRAGADGPLRVPRGSITGASVVRSHAGKTVGRPLVRIDFAGADGPDAAAWYVPDAEAWVAELQPA